MIAKKNPKLNEDKRRGVYFQLGLMVVSASVMMAFTWRGPIHMENHIPKVAESAEIPEIQVQKKIEKPKVIEPKIEKVEPKKTVELRKTKELSQKLKETENKDIDEKSMINDESFKKVLDGDFEIDDGVRPELTEEVVIPDRDAEFIGDWIPYLRKEVVYPERSMQLGDQGKIYVSFVVERDGSITQVKVENKNTPIELQREALRVVRNAPNWKPGMVGGEYVRSRKTVSINFVLH